MKELKELFVKLDYLTGMYNYDFPVYDIIEYFLNFENRISYHYENGILFIKFLNIKLIFNFKRNKLKIKWGLRSFLEFTYKPHLNAYKINFHFYGNDYFFGYYIFHNKFDTHDLFYFIERQAIRNIKTLFERSRKYNILYSEN